MSEIPPESVKWLTSLGFDPADEALWLRALTHGSFDAKDDYERLEFLGDRVLGLTIADWLYSLSKAPEGKLSQRLNALVSREACARVAIRIELPDHIRMGKQARDDGGAQSTNILGDVMEALLGAGFRQSGFAATAKVIRKLWADEMDSDAGTVKHPKSALQEWAAGNQRQPPRYELVDRSGPDHAARFTVRVSVNKVGEAEATASNKQHAEKLAAQAFMEQFG
ncbi:MAG: ribonuclease III [Erythrobacter sp.]